MNGYIEQDVLIVGGGIAGLTAALTLAQRGKKVLLLEKNEQPGGLMNSFVRDGFRFEGGARALVNAGLVKPLIKEFALDVEILPNPITLGIEDKLLPIQGEGSLQAYADMLKELYPDSEDEVDRIIAAIHAIIEDMKVLYGVDSPLFAEKKRNLFVMLPAVTAWMFKFFRTIYRISKMDTPFEDYLAALSANQSLNDIIGQHFFKKTPVFFALSYFALYNDYVYPKGGVGALINAMTEKITELDCELRFSTEIVQVDPVRHILVDASGAEYGYKKLIWAADLKTLYRISSEPAQHVSKKTSFSERKAKILHQKGAESVFTLFLAVDVPPEAFKSLASGHMFYTPDRKGLGDIHGSELKGMLAHWDELQKEQFYDWLHRFCRYNTFEISLPVLRDPDAAPPGKTGIIVSLLFDYELTKKIYDEGWYEEFKEQFESEIITTLAESLYRDIPIRDRILFRFSASPLSIYSHVKSSEGSIVGWSFEGEIPVTASMFRMGDSVNTAFPDIYAAGKWVYSPAGGPTAIMTGRIAASKCLKTSTPRH